MTTRNNFENDKFIMNKEFIETEAFLNGDSSDTIYSKEESEAAENTLRYDSINDSGSVINHEAIDDGVQRVIIQNMPIKMKKRVRRLIISVIISAVLFIIMFTVINPFLLDTFSSNALITKATIVNVETIHTRSRYETLAVVSHTYKGKTYVSKNQIKVSSNAKAGDEIEVYFSSVEPSDVRIQKGDSSGAAIFLDIVIIAGSIAILIATSTSLRNFINNPSNPDYYSKEINEYKKRYFLVNTPISTEISKKSPSEGSSVSETASSDAIPTVHFHNSYTKGTPRGLTVINDEIILPEKNVWIDESGIPRKDEQNINTLRYENKYTPKYTQKSVSGEERIESILSSDEMKELEKNYKNTKRSGLLMIIIPMIFFVGLIIGIVLLITYSNKENDFYTNASVTTAKITDIRVERHSKSTGGKHPTSIHYYVYYGNVEYTYHGEYAKNWVEIPEQSEKGGYVKIWVNNDDYNSIRPYKGEDVKTKNNVKTIVGVILLAIFAIMFFGLLIHEIKEFRKKY